MAGFAEVSDLLWRERELLDVLLFKLEEERLLLEGGGVRWLARASHEIEIVLEQLRLTEATRALEADALASELDLGPSPTLAGLAAAAPSPWSELFAAHRVAFATLVEEVRGGTGSNRRILDGAWRAARELVLELSTDEPPTASDAVPALPDATR